MMDFALSTSWNFNDTTDPDRWIDEARTMGFAGVELSYTIPSGQFDEIRAALVRSDMPVFSLHNFSPLPDGTVPRHSSNFYRLSARDPEERRSAVTWTNHTIDMAAELGARAVVIHAGTLEYDTDPWSSLFDRFKAGDKGGDFESLRRDLMDQRGKDAPEFIGYLKESLREVLDHAKKKSVKVGLETRYYPIEIPNFDEVGLFLSYFKDDPLYYWHDVGHAEMHEKLGLAKHQDYLKSYGHRLAGMHIHGMTGARDHLAPSAGELNMDQYVPYLKEDTIAIIETRFATRDELAAGMERLKERVAALNHS